MDTDEFIADTMRRVAASATPPSYDARRPARKQGWHAPLVVAAAAVTVVLIVAAASVLGSHRSKNNPSAGSPPEAAACRLDHTPKPLPTWARAGFTPPDQPVPYVLSDDGDMTAILWAGHHPLVSPADPDRNNKIMWVARVGADEGPLRIRATLTGTGQTVSRTLPAAGPSTIDLPTPGCWSLDLRWGSHQDHLDLGYAPR